MLGALQTGVPFPEARCSLVSFWEGREDGTSSLPGEQVLYGQEAARPGPATPSQHRSSLAAFLWVFGMSFTCPSVVPSKAGCEVCQSLSIRVMEGSPG